MADKPFIKAKIASLALAAAVLLASLSLAGPVAAQSVRVKDIADVEGVRDNQLVGYGLVVGLAGTGDRLRTAILTCPRRSGPPAMRGRRDH